jgi:hypothetical protein
MARKGDRNQRNNTPGRKRRKGQFPRGRSKRQTVKRFSIAMWTSLSLAVLALGFVLELAYFTILSGTAQIVVALKYFTAGSRG